MEIARNTSQRGSPDTYRPGVREKERERDSFLLKGAYVHIAGVAFYLMAFLYPGRLKGTRGGSFATNRRECGTGGYKQMNLSRFLRKETRT